ncbi:restriction endonuclease [Caldisalinibacter kiritimatiensis]|uniref:Restriction endonuclease type IV Mrr domain-containing protein n=1 Tax=Caldisalinibacter kiritimatiensis TaxID=1304284 RepID=R1AVY1_9FIRM|nr:restriction endonuclease [Caldisalinibacter kiritimatiensis]EOD01343.1 hypothetical protein L21TH_0564 [Caldisalinibacter kiritimatiensis]
MEKRIEISRLNKKIRKVFNNRKIKRYYIEENKKGKTYIAILLDAVLTRILITIIFFGYFLYMTKDLFFSSVLTLQFFILFNLIIYKVNAIKLKKTIKHINEKLAKEKITKDLLNKTPYEFIDYIKMTLEKCAIDDMRIFHQNDIDILGKLNEHTVGIKCFQYTEDNYVDINDIREFFLGLKELDIEEGFVVTTSYFEESVKEFIPKLESHAKIHLIDINEFLKFMKKAELYPRENDIRQIILDKIAERRRKLIEYRKKFLSKGQTTKYILIAVILYLWGRITPYERYYKIVAYVLFGLGIISLGKYFIELFTSGNQEENNYSN